MTASPENTGKKQDGRFKPGQSGNPKGKPKGCMNKATRAAMEMLDGEAEAVTRKVLDKALYGNPQALRIVFERIIPVRKEAPVSLSLPEITKAADVVTVQANILAAVAAGDITPGEGETLAKMAEGLRRSIETEELEQRITALEEGRHGRR